MFDATGERKEVKKKLERILDFQWNVVVVHVIPLNQTTNVLRYTVKAAQGGHDLSLRPPLKRRASRGRCPLDTRLDEPPRCISTPTLNPRGIRETYSAWKLVILCKCNEIRSCLHEFVYVQSEWFAPVVITCETIDSNPSALHFVLHYFLRPAH